MARLSGQKALITGAASGFGRGIAQAMSRAGASVMITDIDAEGAAAVAAELSASGAVAHATTADIADMGSLDAAMRFAEDALGGLSCVVANAGIGQSPRPLAETSTELFHQHYDLNALGAVRTCKAALPVLRRSDVPASILLTVSAIAMVPRPALYAYGMAKAAAAYFMKALAVELAPEKIRVNGLFPAVGDTPMLQVFSGGTRSADADARFAGALPLGRLITPEDVGAAAVYLASPDEAGAMTGCALPIDAGRTI